MPSKASSIRTPIQEPQADVNSLQRVTKQLKEAVDRLQYALAPASTAGSGASGSVSGAYLPLIGGTLTGPLTLAGAPTVDLHASTKKYVDDKAAAGGTFDPSLYYDKTVSDARFVNVAGDSMTGPLVLSGAPTIDLHPASKKYVDDKNVTQDAAIAANASTFNSYYDKTASDARYVNTAGDTMTGLLTLSAAPTLDLHAATKKYVDDKAAAGGTFDPALYYDKTASDARFVDVAGDTMTGNLVLESVTPILRFHESDAVSPAGQYGFSASGSGDFSFVRYSGVGFTTPVTIWNYLPVTDKFSLFSTLTLGSSAPTLYLEETDQVDPAGRFRLTVDGDVITLQKSIAANWATRSNLWSYNNPLGKFVFTPTVVVSGSNPVLEFDENDATSPLGHYRFWLDGGTFSFQNALTANFATFQNIFQFKSVGDGGTGTFNVFPGMSINGAVGASTCPLKLDGTYPGIWFHDSTPSGISADLLLTAGNGWWRFSVTDATGAVGDDVFTINPTTPMVTSYLPMTSDLTASGATSVYPFTARAATGATAYATRILDGAGAEVLAMYSSSTNNIVLRNRNGTGSTVSYLQLNADTSAILGASGGCQFTGAIDVASTFNQAGICNVATTSGHVNVGSAATSFVNFQRTSSINYIRLPAAASLRVQTSDTAVAWATVSSASGWTAGSDIKLKKNVAPIHYGLDTVMAMKPIQFDWIVEDRHDIGFVAQEMIKVVPEVIDDLDDDNDEHTTTLHLRKDGLVPVLAKAIQEQQALIVSLTRRVIELEARL